MQGTMPGTCRQGRTCMALMDNIDMWTGLPVEELVRMTEINRESMSMVWPTLGWRTAKEQNRTMTMKLYNADEECQYKCLVSRNTHINLTTWLIIYLRLLNLLPSFKRATVVEYNEQSSHIQTR